MSNAAGGSDDTDARWDEIDTAKVSFPDADFTAEELVALDAGPTLQTADITLAADRVAVADLPSPSDWALVSINGDLVIDGSVVSVTPVLDADTMSIGDYAVMVTASGAAGGGSAAGSGSGSASGSGGGGGGAP